METTTIADYLYDTTTVIRSTLVTDHDIGFTDKTFLDLTALTPNVAADRLLHTDDQLTHNQITFEIPSHHDLEHINTLHTFNTLLQRIGNVAYDTVASATQRHQPVGAVELRPLGVDAAGERITSEQISKSAVLNLADLKNGVDGVGGSFLERFFGDADMHAVINYLWVGVVTSLVVLSVVFIVFSCYFYRKFRQWKKCNKDIRNHLNNDIYNDGHVVVCDRLMDAHGQHPATAAVAAAYYQQMESPPCYTIATGLPSYDEALHHHPHFSYGMKFVYPSITAVHHHPAIAGVYGGSNNNNNHNTNSNATITTISKQQSGEQTEQQQLMKQNSYKVLPVLSSSETEELDVPATYDIAELHNINLPAAAMGVATPLLGINANLDGSARLEEAVITIRLDDMIPAATLAATSELAASAATTRIPTLHNQRHHGDDDELCSAVTIA